MLFYQFFKLKLLQSQFRQLKPAIQKRVLRACARAGATVIRKHYKKQLRQYRRTQSLEKALGVVVRLYNADGNGESNVVGYAGVRRDKSFVNSRGKKVKPGWYNHLLELGRRGFQRKLLRRNPPTPFANGKPRYIPAASGKYPLKKAIAAAKPEVDAKVQETFQKRMAAELAKIAAKGA